MNYIVLIFAGIFEAGFAFCLAKMKDTETEYSVYWVLGFAICLLISMFLLYKATETIPIGVAYATWTGIGVIGTALVGFFMFNEAVTPLKIFFLIMLVASIVGLKLASES